MRLAERSLWPRGKCVPRQLIELLIDPNQAKARRVMAAMMQKIDVTALQ